MIDHAGNNHLIDPDGKINCDKCGIGNLKYTCRKCYEEMEQHPNCTPTSKIDDLIEKYETIDVIKVMGIRVLSANEVIKNLKKLKEGK